MATSQKVCKDCKAAVDAYEAWLESGYDPEPYPGEPLPASVRPAPHPGPRCATHHRKFRQARRARTHATYVRRTYGLADGDYGRVLEAQGGVCAICQRANGATRKLSVDHDHACCDGPVSCGQCVRGLICRPCNDLLGHARDDTAFFARAIQYLMNPPAKGVLRP